MFREYEIWKKEEEDRTDAAYKEYVEGTTMSDRYLVAGIPDASGQAGYRVGNMRGIVTRVAAAVLILAVGTGIWLKREAIFGSRYTEEQIELAYEHTIKILSRYSESLSSSTKPLKNINLDETHDL
jgi:hypothetical protein